MTYQELINNIIDLGFSDDDEMAEFGELVPNSINRAISEINVNVAPIIERYEFDIEDEDEGYLYISMSDVDSNFMMFGETPVMVRQGDTEIYKKFADFYIEAQDTIVIDASKNKGSFRIFYRANHEPFTGDDSQLSQELPLPLKVHHIVPLIAAYYVWLEDEPAKAAQYYNLYEQESQAILNTDITNQPRMRVLEGGL